MTTPTPPAVPARHALGLPAGSVRALLTIMVLGIVWALMLLPEERAVPIPLYLYYLMFLVLGHFFAAHGHSIGGASAAGRSPLYLPRGTLRLAIVAGFVGVVAYLTYLGRDLSKIQPSLADQPFLPVVLLGTFFLGVLVKRMVQLTTGGEPYWFQDIQAWVALLAMLGLGAEVIIQAIINPTLAEDKQLHLPEWQTILTGIVGFYFGARS